MSQTNVPPAGAPLLDPTPEAEAHYEAGNVFFDGGDYHRAGNEYRKAIKLSPNYELAHFRWGLALYNQGYYQRSTKRYKEVIRINKASVFDAHINLGIALDDLGKYQEAIDSYQRAIDYYEKNPGPNYAVVLSNCGYTQQTLRKYGEAIALYEKSTKQTPPYVRAWVNWGDVLFLQQEYAEALDKYLGALEIESSSISFGRWIDCLDKLGKAEKSQKAAAFHQLAENTKSAPLYNQWAVALVERERYEEAYEKYQKAFDLNPLNPATLSDWGTALFNQKRFAKAVEKYLAAVGIDPVSIDYDKWVVALDGLTRSEKSNAVAEFQRVAIGSDYAPAYRLWADVLVNQGEHKEAGRIYETAVRLDPDDAVAYEKWGEALLKLGKSSDAVEKFEKAATNTHAPGFVSWGDLLLSQKKFSESAEKYLAAIRIDQDSVDYAKWAQALQQCDLEDRERFASELWNLAGNNAGFSAVYDSWGLALAELKDYKAAFAQFRRATELDPQSSRAHARWGDALLDSGNCQEAVEQYLCVVREDFLPINYQKLVTALDGLGDENKDQTFKRILEIIKDDDSYSPFLSNWGDNLSNLKRFDEAIEIFKKAIEADAENADAHYGCGNALFSLKRYEDAIETFEQALNVYPKLSMAYNYWGYALLVLKNYWGAIDKFERAIESDATNVLPYLNWGKALEGLKSFEASLDKYKQAAEVAPNSGQVYLSWGAGMAESKRYDEAQDTLNKAIELEPDTVNGTYAAHNIGYFLFRQGKYAEGRIAWRRALDAYARTQQSAIDTFDADYFQSYGSILQTVFDETDEAERVYKQGLELDPNHVALLTSLVTLYLEKKDKRPGKRTGGAPYWKAREFFQRAERVLQAQVDQLDDAGVWLQFGQLLLSLGDYMTEAELTRAENCLTKALAKDANSADTYTNLGVLYTRKKDFVKAIKNFTDAFKLDPDDLNVWSNLAEAYVKSAAADNADPGLKEKAETEFKRILEVAPNHVESIMGLGEVYKAMGDAAKDEDLYIRAIEQFDLGIQIADSDAGSKTLKKRDRAAALYSAGYAKVKLYEAATAKDEGLLHDAFDYFRRSVEDDPENFKAIRAFDRIDKRLKRFSSQRAVEKFGPRIILLGAAMIFSVAQASAIKHWPIADLGPTNYTLLSFGSLLFAVAGLSLPQLLKLKVPGIELEKSAVEQITTAGALGISK
jgi:tetratricopeptide (TPR) repeat protein